MPDVAPSIPMLTGGPQLTAATRGHADNKIKNRTFTPTKLIIVQFNVCTQRGPEAFALAPGSPQDSRGRQLASQTAGGDGQHDPHDRRHHEQHHRELHAWRGDRRVRSDALTLGGTHVTQQ